MATISGSAFAAVRQARRAGAINPCSAVLLEGTHSPVPFLLEPARVLSQPCLSLHVVHLASPRYGHPGYALHAFLNHLHAIEPGLFDAVKAMVATRPAFYPEELHARDFLKHIEFGPTVSPPTHHPKTTTDFCVFRRGTRTVEWRRCASARPNRFLAGVLLP